MTDRETPATHAENARTAHSSVPEGTTDYDRGHSDWVTPARETPAGAVEALERLIVEHRTATWPAQLRATSDGGGWTYESHLARFLTASGYSLTRSVDVERWQRIETAAPRLIAIFNLDKPDNGHCRTCHGYWLGGHASECPYAALRDALGEG